MEPDEVDRICHLLAVRVNPDLAQYHEWCWTDFPFNSKINKREFLCLICDTIICAHDEFAESHKVKLYNHGFHHIKEKNLLSFI